MDTNDAQGGYHVEIDWDATLERVNGMEYVHQGVHGFIRAGRARNGMTYVEHYASPRGRTSLTYRMTRLALGDDYITDLSDDEQLWAEVERRGLVVTVEK